MNKACSTLLQATAGVSAASRLAACRKLFLARLIGSHAAIPIWFALAAFVPAASAQTQVPITSFTKDNNIYTNLNQQFPNTGAGVPGSGVGVANATFLFNPATYTSTDAVAGSNLANNGVNFLLASDASGHDFEQIHGSVTIPVNLSGVLSFYTFMGSYFGGSVTVTFTGADGATEVFTNVSLPDFNGGGSLNLSSAVDGSATDNEFDQTVFQVTDVGAGGSGNSSNGGYTTYILVEQSFVLDAALAAEPLTSVTITSTGGTPLLLGATAEVVAGPGTVQLSAATATVAEAVGSATLSVNRIGGSGTVSVNYATADGTAAAGTDYQAASGTLSWADGDTTAKTITVPITNRNLGSGSTFFLVNLSNPTGGATLGAPTQEAVTVLDIPSAANLQSVTLLSPPAGVTLTQGQSVSLRVDAEALSGTLARVEFFAVDAAGNSTDLGGTSDARGQIIWTPAAAGSFTLQVVATDTSGNTQQTASPVTVAAAAGVAALPQTSLDGGLDGITVPLNTTVQVTAQAVDSNGNPLQNAQFYLDGVPVATTPITGTTAARRTEARAADTTGTAVLFEASVLVSKIEQLLTAVGTTAGGVSSVSAPITLYAKAEAGTPPAAAITNVASGAAVATGQSVSVVVTPGSQPVARVQLVVDSQVVGTATAAPYTFNLPALAASSHVMSVIATDITALSGVSAPVLIKAQQAASTPAFFAGQAALSNGVYYLAFANGNFFGYYSFLADPAYLYHFDLGYEYVFDAADGQGGVYFYDFASSTFFYTSPVFPFPYLYDFTLNSVLYYYPDPHNPGRYNTDGIRYFYDFNTGTIITK